MYLMGIAALLGASYLLLSRDFDRMLFMESFREMRPGWIAASVFATFVSYALRAVRWRRLLAPFKSVRWSLLFHGTILGFAAIYAAGRPGEVVRPLWVARQEDLPVTGAVATIVVERVFDSLMIVLLLAVGLGAADAPAGAGGSVAALSRAAWLLLIGSLTAMGLLFLSHRNAAGIKARLRFGRLRRLFEMFAVGAGALSNAGAVAVVAGHSALVWIAIALQFWLMLVGLNLGLPPATAVLVLAVTGIGSLAQLPGIGGGFQAAFVFSVTVFGGIASETALAGALLAWWIVYIPTLSAAALYMAWKGFSTKALVRELRTDSGWGP